MQKVWLSFFIPTIGTNVPNDEQDKSTYNNACIICMFFN